MPFTSTGSGDPVLLLHGLGGFKESWGNLPTAIAASGRRAVAPDLPGGAGQVRHRRRPVSSASIARALEPFLERLGAAHLVGHSLGGQVAIMLAAGRPDLVRSMALIAPVIVPRGVPVPPRRGQDVMCIGAIGPVLARLSIARRRRRPGSCRASLLAVTGDPVHLPPDGPEARLLEEAAERLVHADLHPYTTWASSGLRRGALVEAALAAAPTLTIMGDRDPLCPAVDRSRIERVLAPRDHLVLDQVGHFPYLEAARPTEAAIVEHLGGVVA